MKIDCYIKGIVFGLGLLSLSCRVAAQNTTSPYSILGIGDIEQSTFDRTSGMGHAGLAYRSTRNMNHSNPASYTALPKQFFNVEVSARGKFTKYFGNNVNMNTSDGVSQDFSPEKIALGVKINNWWGSGVGLSPFSTSNYYFSDNSTILGTTDVAKHVYNGSGGVHQVYWANGVQLGKHFSVGVNAALLFGSLNQEDSILSGSGDPLVTTTRNIYLRNFYFLYGAQYSGKLNKHWNINVGGTFSNKTGLLAEYTTQVTDHTGEVIKDVPLQNSTYSIPLTYGAGVSAVMNNKYTFSADYKYQNWGSLNYQGSGYALVNSTRYSVGFEYSKQKQIWDNMVETKFWQAGAFYDNSYMQVYGQQLQAYGFTVGMGLNSKRAPLSYMFAAEIGSRGARTGKLVQEQYVGLTITLSYRDFWLTKGRKYN